MRQLKLRYLGYRNQLAINGYIVNVVAIQSSGGEICKAYFASFCFLIKINISCLSTATVSWKYCPSIAVSRQYFYFFAEPLRIRIASLGLFLFVRFDNVVWGVISSMLAAVHAWWQNKQCPRQKNLPRKSTTSTCESAYVMLNHTANIKQYGRRWQRSDSPKDYFKTASQKIS
jgi:hypothetical protein